MTPLRLVTDEERAASLARFQADPAKVRVSVCHGIMGCGDLRECWYAEVWVRGERGPRTREHHEDPAVAVQYALVKAERMRVPGVDLAMGWTYEHPFGAAGVARREAVGR